jgi:hypothetical protein
MQKLSAIPEDAQFAPTPANEAVNGGKKSRKRNRKSPVAAEEPQVATQVSLPKWPQYVQTATDGEIQRRFTDEVNAILLEGNLSDRYACVAIFEPLASIMQFEVDQIFAALAAKNGNSTKDVLLFLLSPGGAIEPAYQIAKTCKMVAKNKFVVCIPRQAKSAATLISLGADEIHMSLLGQLGPIDPQVQGLPALGVSQALETLASLVQKYPGSADMFAKYLQGAVKVEQIGYYDRVTESAVQYAERLLEGKQLQRPASEIAHELVYEYKDHGFVIDLDEARRHLGSNWIMTGTPEALAGERIYRLFEVINLFLNTARSKRMWVAGSFDDGVFIFERKRAV